MTKIARHKMFRITEAYGADVNGDLVARVRESDEWPDDTALIAGVAPYSCVELRVAVSFEAIELALSEQSQ